MAMAEMNQEVLAQLMDDHQEQLLLIIRFRMDTRIKRRISPEDILQEVYLAANKRIKHYDPEKHSAFLWLRLLTVQTMYDIYRQHVGAQGRDVRKEAGHNFDMAATSASLFFQISGGGTSPSVKVMRAEKADQLRKLLEELSPLDQEVLALRHFEELNNGEVATVLGIEKKAASIRYVRALRRLKGVLADSSGEYGGNYNGADSVG